MINLQYEMRIVTGTKKGNYIFRFKDIMQAVKRSFRLPLKKTGAPGAVSYCRLKFMMPTFQAARRKAVFMLTLQELKQIVEVPVPGQKIPTARKLRTSGVLTVWEKLNRETKIAAYQNGYTLYEAGGFATVFPVHSCREYQYDSGEQLIHIGEGLFEHEAWYLRLMLEGEDRLVRNQETRERERTVSYSALSEEWRMLEEAEISALEQLIQRETVSEILAILTEQQRVVTCRFFLEQKTQNQISKELGITAPAVSKVLSRAIRRVRRKYSFQDIAMSIAGYGRRR